MTHLEKNLPIKGRTLSMFFHIVLRKCMRNDEKFSCDNC